MKQEFLQSKVDTIKMRVFADNCPVIPSAATITIYKPGSTTAFIAETAGSVDATTGELSYSFTADNLASTGLNYKATWKYTVGGVDYYQNQLFDVVKSKLAIPVVDEDLFNELPILSNEATQATGTATSATTSTLVDSKRKEANDYWAGGTLEIISGTGDGQKRDITDFVQSTGTITVSPAFATTPDTTSVYRIVRAFTKQIEQSFEKISTMIYNKGKRHSLILESSQIKIPLIYLTIHFICLDLMKSSDDIWHTRALMYWDRFNESFGGMALDYDEDESGAISGEDEQQASPAGFYVSRG